MKLVNKISGHIQNSFKYIDIQLDGKNLIVAGGNGSGKTSLATSIFQSLQTQINSGELANLENYKKQVSVFETKLADPNLDPESRQIAFHNLSTLAKKLELARGPIDIEYNQPFNFINQYQSEKTIVRFFTADRKANINHVSSATASQPDRQHINIQSALGNNLEQHLVNLKVRSALAAQAGEVGERPLHAIKWISSLTENLKYLFEDQSTELVFAPDQLRFYILQEGKRPYSFQSLSSGYLAILDIYADLLMHTEYTEIKPSELTGVVIVDEIDAHLHVSLQRKILPFFTSSFPQIQFIVTTHSPFVLTSVDNAVIYDITTNRTVSDLSMYSYESVVEGLLGVPPISKILEDTIKKLTKITNIDNFDLQVAENLLNTITPHIDVLDAESEMFYHIAANKIIKFKTEIK